MTTWKYLVETALSWEALNEVLEVRGGESWELVTVTEHRETFPGDEYATRIWTLYFKQPVQ